MYKAIQGSAQGHVNGIGNISEGGRGLISGKFGGWTLLGPLEDKRGLNVNDISFKMKKVGF